MGALWQSIETPTPSSPARNDDTAVGGAVPCVVGNRVFLLGGSGTTTSDPDIALQLFSWSAPSSSEHPDGVSKKGTTAATASAPAGTSLATRTFTTAPVAPVLKRLVSSQEGDVPAARIGHAAVTLVDPASSTSIRPARIVLFGGEASNPTPASSAEDGSGYVVHLKLGDVYEATAKCPSGTLVWRALAVHSAVLDTPREASTATAKVLGGVKNGLAPIESEDAPKEPSPMAFHASCAAPVSSGGSSGDTELAMLIHGGIDQSSKLLGDLWAFFPGEVGVESEASNVGRGGSRDCGGRAAGWERLQTEGEGPPPAAYHSATPVNSGRIVVFIGGGKNWGPSSIFLLDTVGLVWSSFDASGGVGLSEQRCLHTAISVTGVDTGASSDEDQRQEESESHPPSSHPEDTRVDDATTSASTVQLWGPVAMGALPAPGSARSAGSEKGAVGGASGKKKPGTKDGSGGSKKAGTKDAAKNEPAGGGVVDGGDPDTESGNPPVFESVLVFGGIVGSTTVSGDATVLHHDGKVTPLRLARKSPAPPGPRFSHAMVSVPISGSGDHSSNGGGSGGDHGRVGGNPSGLGQLAFLFGGCRGDGTRAAEGVAFLLDIAGGGGSSGAAGEDGVAEEAGGGHGVDGEDAEIDKVATFDGGDIYTGQLDADGRRQGKGRCDYGVSVGTAKGEGTGTVPGPSSAGGGSGGGGGGGSYVGEWDADTPHGHGERVYPRPKEDEGRGREGGGSGGEGGGVEMAVMAAAFGPDCPPLASYRGVFKRGIRDGRGMCLFFALGPAATAGSLGATRKSRPVPVPESYDGEWVDGRPMGRGILTLRAAAAVAAAAAPAPSSGPYPSSVPGSASVMTTTRDGTGHGGSAGGGRRGGDNSATGGSIEGLWTKDGLVQGREKLPGKGGVYEGQYRLGRREGHGRLELPDGSEYEGAWRNGRQNGIGTFRCGVTRHTYTGKWVGGVRCGRGVCEYASGSRYDGLWLDGLRHGEGVLSGPPGSDGNSLAGLWHRDVLSLACAIGERRRPSSTETSGAPEVKVVE